jgi:AP-4 complex subunit mu-1
MISQFFVVNLRGDSVILKNCKSYKSQCLTSSLDRNELPKEVFAPDLFFKLLTTCKREELCPLVNFEVSNLPIILQFLKQTIEDKDLYFLATEQESLYLVILICVTSNNGSCLLSLSSYVELLLRTVQLFKDYCGILNEEAIRKNFALLYELLDEIFVHTLD